MDAETVIKAARAALKAWDRSKEINTIDPRLNRDIVEGFSTAMKCLKGAMEAYDGSEANNNG